MEKEQYDLIIVGAGPAGLSSAIYAARYKLKYLIFGRAVGGVMTEAYDVENYPGLGKTSGNEITKKMLDQLKDLGTEVIQKDVKDIEKKDGLFRVIADGEEYLAKKILLAVGTKRNKLGIPGEDELCGKGVSYCATCDGFFFKGKDVAVIGGGDAAAGAAVYLSNVAKKVYIILRRDVFRADPSWQEKIAQTKNIEILKNTHVTEIVGKDKVEKIILDKAPKELTVNGVFIEIGETPQNVLFDKLGVKRDLKGYVEVHKNQMTSQAGVWAAGDTTNGSNEFRQIVTACAEGAVAIVSIFTEIRKEK